MQATRFGIPTGTRTPIFLIGAPRSGSTFLTSVLNCHPRVHVTNEARFFVLFQHVLTRLVNDDRMVGRDYAELLTPLLRGHLRSIAEGVYLSQAHTDGKQLDRLLWLGEKYPHYADPYETPGSNTGCMELILQTFPEARLIHIHRHPFQSVASVVRKGWLELGAAADVWEATSAVCDDLCSRRAEHSHSVAWWDLCQHPKREAERLGRFLALEDWSPIEAALVGNAERPIEVSDPETRPFADAALFTLSEEDRHATWERVASSALRLGYAMDRPHARQVEAAG